MKKHIKTNILLNVIKTVIVAVFPLITYPYVCRILGVENMGKISFVSSFISYFSIVASLGILNYAIRTGAPIRNELEKRNQFFNEIFTINFSTMLLAYFGLLILCLCSSFLRSYSLLFIIQSLSFVFAWIGCEWVFSIYEDYLMITIRTIVSHLLSLAAIFIFVKTENDYIIYSLISVLASGMSYVINYLFLNKYYRPKITFKPNFRKHFLPMLLLGANSLAIIVYVGADVTMIGLFMTDFDVGLYSTGVKIYNLLKQIMSAIIAVSAARVAFYYNSDKEKYNNLVVKVFKILFMVSVPASIGLCMVSPDVIYLFAGHEYIGGVDSLRIISFAIPFASIGSLSAMYGLIVQKKEKIVLIVTVSSALINVCLNIFFIPWLGINGAAITTLISEFIICVSFVILTKFYLLFIKSLKTIIFVLLGSVGIFVICYFAYIYISSLSLRLPLAILASIICYSIFILFSKDEIVMNEIKKVFKRRKKHKESI